MDIGQQLVDIAQRYYGWRLSFDGEYFSGICQASSWPPNFLNRRETFPVYLQRQPNTAVPFPECTDFSAVLLNQSGEAACRSIALVHPGREADCLDEVLYGGLLHLTTLPLATKLSIALPPEYAAVANEHHMEMLRQPRYAHPPRYRVGSEFHRFPHPLPVVPSEESLETVLLMQQLPETRSTD